jgi:hypothetical protein
MVARHGLVSQHIATVIDVTVSRQRTSQDRLMVLFTTGFGPRTASFSRDSLGVDSGGGRCKGRLPTGARALSQVNPECARPLTPLGLAR